MKKLQPGKLIVSLLLPQVVGGLGAVFTTANIPTWYASLTKPAFSPPNWLFGPVWTLLYLMMGVALYLIWTSQGKKALKTWALQCFGFQLIFNFFWSVVFFGLRSPQLGLLDITALWLLIALTIQAFGKISKTARWLLIPYLAWVSFATLLNAAIVLLN